MQEKEKLISISRDAWHYKLIKDIWDINPSTFRNLCPYFWLVVAGLMALPFVKLYRWFASFLNWMTRVRNDRRRNNYSRNYTQWVASLKPYEVVEISNNGIYSDLLKIPKPIKDKEYSWKIVRDYLQYHKIGSESEFIKEHETEWKKYFEKENAKIERKLEKERKKEEEKAKALKKRQEDLEKAENVIKNCKKAIGVLITLFMMTVVFFLTSILVWLFTSLIQVIADNISVTIDIVTVLLLLFGSIGVLTVYYIFTKDTFENFIYSYGKLKWYEYLFISPYLLIAGIVAVLYYVLYKFLYLKVLKPFGLGLWFGLTTFTGIFGEYFSASYSDYCPGIEWDEENSK